MKEILLTVLDNMLNRLENLANEILLMILDYIRWFEMIESFGSLNKRFNDIIYLKLSITNNEIVISEKCLSFNNSKLLRFVNLKRLILKKCYLTKNLMAYFLFLIEYQLDELIFTIDKDVFELTYYERKSRIIRHNESKLKFLLLDVFNLKSFCSRIGIDAYVRKIHTYIIF